MSSPSPIRTACLAIAVLALPAAAIAEGAPPTDCFNKCLSKCVGPRSVIENFDSVPCVECKLHCVREERADEACAGDRSASDKGRALRNDLAVLKTHYSFVDAKCSNIPPDEPKPDEVRAECGKLKAKIRGEIQGVETELARLEQAGGPGLSCDQLSGQLKKDQEAVKRLQKTMENGLKELEQWAKENADAAADALRKGEDLFVASGLDFLKERQKAREELNSLASAASVGAGAGKSAPPDTLLGEIRLLSQRFGELERKVAALKGDVFIKAAPGSDTLDALELNWTSFKLNANALSETLGQTDQDLKRIASNPWVAEILRTENARHEALEGIRDGTLTLLKLSLGATAGKSFDLLQFLAEYGYEATRWEVSRRRILEENHLTEGELKALETLRIQERKTVCKLKQSGCGGKTS